MDAIVDVVYVLSIFAAVAALFFRFTTARAEKRALALIRRDPHLREPGLALEVIGASMSRTRSGDQRLYDVEVRLTNPADSWNVFVNVILEVEHHRDGESRPPLKVPIDQTHARSAAGTLSVPLVAPARDSTTGHFFFRVREKLLQDASIDRYVIIAVDIDGRRMEGVLPPV